ncbi:MAG TPA: dihydroorotate dehydrogenase catalytic subunit, partial [Candidatus Acidoferrum sp.]|nr:dihydroorotate dehydrogenase catalytic subunit [Candidatus Acidoferrum sp.]
MTSAGPVDLSVNIGALRLKNPIIAASGTFGYGLEFAHLVDLNSIGGFVTKGLSLNPIQGSPEPRLCQTPSGMLNAVGLQNVGVRVFVAEKLPVLSKYVAPVLVNIFGYTPEEYAEVIGVLQDVPGIAGYELNISCPNVKQGGVQFGSDPALVSQVVGIARRAAVDR